MLTIDEKRTRQREYRRKSYWKCKKDPAKWDHLLESHRLIHGPKYREMNREKERLRHLKYKDRYKDKTRARARARKDFLSDYKRERGCFLCQEHTPCCLDFHHTDPSTKEHTIGAMRSYSEQRMMDEIKKCVVLCANCHRKLGAGLIALPSPNMLQTYPN